MATRQSVDKLLQQCEDALRYAQSQLSEGMKQEHYNDTEYTKAQLGLENAYKELEGLAHSANDQQREQLYRMRLQIQQTQNQMILTEH
ncbi:YtzC family protein [Priestia flexa]|uniref:YtzC family protein n=1 Tax=Priestia flexa TaxID=86664 RepID=UPI00240D85E7|nr:YtzC family protein [Priestia flexa]WEZ09215.1 YtzC family protein [Priestia flexa]